MFLSSQAQLKSAPQPERASVWKLKRSREVLQPRSGTGPGRAVRDPRVLGVQDQTGPGLHSSPRALEGMTPLETSPVGGFPVTKDIWSQCRGGAEGEMEAPLLLGLSSVPPCALPLHLARLFERAHNTVTGLSRRALAQGQAEMDRSRSRTASGDDAAAARSNRVGRLTAW